MRINTKIIIGFLIITFLFVAAIFLTVYINLKISSLYSELNEAYVPFTKAAIEITSYSKRAEGHLTLFLILNNKADRDKFFQRIDSLKNEISIIEPLATDSKDIETLNIIKSVTNEILRYGNELLEEYDKNPSSFNPKDHEELIRKFYNTTSVVREKGVNLSSIQSYSIANKASIIEKDVKNIQYILLIFIMFAMCLSMGLGLFTSKSISTSIKKLTNNVEDISMGKLDVEVDPKLKESKDEIGALARAFDRTIVSLKLAMKQSAPEREKEENS
jgi:methyl-accepting chemotaxis protein